MEALPVWSAWKQKKVNKHADCPENVEKVSARITFFKNISGQDTHVSDRHLSFHIINFVADTSKRDFRFSQVPTASINTAIWYRQFSPLKRRPISKRLHGTIYQQADIFRYLRVNASYAINYSKMSNDLIFIRFFVTLFNKNVFLITSGTYLVFTLCFNVFSLLHT